MWAYPLCKRDWECILFKWNVSKNVAVYRNLTLILERWNVSTQVQQVIKTVNGLYCKVQGIYDRNALKQVYRVVLSPIPRVLHIVQVTKFNYGYMNWKRIREGSIDCFWDDYVNVWKGWTLGPCSLDFRKMRGDLIERYDCYLYY